MGPDDQKASSAHGGLFTLGQRLEKYGDWRVSRCGCGLSGISAMAAL
jgi:hypothetical protein